MSTTPRLEGKVAIITGASGGIGEAAARLFAKNGARLVIADIKDDLGIAVAASIGTDICKYKRCDVRDEKQVSDLVDYTVSTYGQLDIMYSNAAVIGTPSTVAGISLEEMDNILAVNVRGSAACVKHAARAMLAAGTRGSIVCTGSISGSIAGMGPPSYTISKHALVGLVKAATREFGEHGIRINCVSPAGLATPMTMEYSGMTEEETDAGCMFMANLKGFPLKPIHVAQAALFLASDEAAYVSGHNFNVDGGISAVGPKPPEINIQ
ncbi:hypothetical protein LUZ60_015952 [Juncus effusus]|nr:hypothetical protein LUZ60_015952 [Juncus effusus]